MAEYSLTKEQEHALALAAAKGDKNAMNSLMDEYLPRVYKRVCVSIPYTDAEDLTQEIFLSVVRALKSFRGDSAFSTWLFRIVHRRIVDYYRKSKQILNEQPLDESIRSQGQSPGRVDDNLVIKKALSALKPDQQEIIQLRLVDGYSFQEIAELLKIELGAAKLRFYRAVKACQQEAGI